VPQAASREIETDLAKAERDGLVVSFIGRSVVLSVVGLWLAYGTIVYHASTAIGLAVVLVYLGTSLALIRYFRKGGHLWVAFAFSAAEIVGIGLVAALAPLAAGGGVPQIFVFRVYNVGYFILPIAIGALSLSPALVLCAGLVACLTLWGTFLWVVSGMDRRVSWESFLDGGTAEEYMRIVLDPDFVGTGNRIEETIAIGLIAGLIAFAVHRARMFFRNRAIAEQRQRQILEVFGQYVPSFAVSRLVDNPSDLAPRTLQGSVIFVDMAGFTRFSEGRPAAEVIGTLNDLFDLITRVIAEREGVVAGFAGDAVCAAFTLADNSDESARQALAAAEEIASAVSRRRFGSTTIEVRIGVASGEVAAGSVGGRRRRTYTVYGDPVNVSQRLQELCKTLGKSILVTEETWRLAGSPDGYVDHGITAVRGRDGSLRVYSTR
jgi:class 3 adenylate cyclase